jgi:type IV pilus assembly protein PilY1
VRVYTGSGDRQNIRDLNGGDCGLSNLRACLRKSCTVSVNQSDNLANQQFATGTMSLSSGTYSTTAAIDSAAAQSQCGDEVNSRTAYTIACGSNSLTTSTQVRYNCSTSGCAVTQEKPLNTIVSSTASTNSSTFLSISLFGGSANRVPFNNMTAAANYDTARLTNADLTDVTAATSTTAATSLAPEDGNGWLITYTGTNERTASGSALLAGCVVWNTLEPRTRASLCDPALVDDGRTYTANYKNGGLSCGTLTLSARFTTRNAIVPPPMPTPVVSLNPRTQEVRYSLVAIEPSTPPAQTSVGQGDLLGTIHWLEVSRQLHECRHAGNCQ